MYLRILFSILILCCVGTTRVQAADNPSVQVAEAYLDLRTGPGRGYPRTQIVERGDWVEILMRRTDWLQVRTDKGLVGWAYQDDMALTLDPDGEPTRIPTVGEDEFIHRRWEAGFRIGTFEGARAGHIYLGYYFTDQIAVEVSGGQAYGTGVDYQFLNVSVTHQPWPNQRYSPYIIMGGGAKGTTYTSTQVQITERTDQTVHAGLGIRIYLARQLLARVEYRDTVILTDQEKNQESDEWTIGLSAFF